MLAEYRLEMPIDRSHTLYSSSVACGESQRMYWGEPGMAVR